MARPGDDVPRPPRLGPWLAALAFLGILAVAALGAAGRIRTIPAEPLVAATPAAPAPAALPEPPAAPPAPPERFTSVTVRLGKNQTLAKALYGLDLDSAQVKGIVDALTGIFPFHRARPGDQIRLERREGEDAVHRLAYRQSAADEWLVERLPDGSLRGAKRDVAITTELARVEARIEGSLYETLLRSGEDTGLAVLAADVLAWDVDFYQDVRGGDTLRVLVEKTYADGKFLRYGEVHAAEYAGEATGRKRLFRYTDPSGQTSYFDDDGQSARRGFLRSPLKFAQITSRFGNRRHPVLGYDRAHQGVDYRAPVGTPVWAVGDGQVKLAGWNGGCGKAVHIRHRNGYETVYCHLSSIAVSAGKAVSQKQIIGYSGNTGLSSGPHLHFGVKRGGQHVNPLQLKLPRDVPVKPEWMADYRDRIAPLRAALGDPLVRL
jgi:murein DD-endopeptidase MepM/ murein hydrolase activator NlpD